MPYVVTSEEMRALDCATIEELGLPGALLMEHAGRAVADEVRTLAARPARVAVLCGSGNNGGDGYVCARWLREAGYDARIYLAAGRPRAGGDAALHLAVYENTGGPVVDVSAASTLAAHVAEISSAAVLVDALLGTGLSKDVTGHLADVIAIMNRASGPIVACDLPSGLDADSGRVLGVAVAPACTVTFGFAKVGLVSDPGFTRVGRLRVADIGIPRELPAKSGVKLWLTDEAAARALVPRRPAGGHKGTFGHVLVLAGSAGKTGAALLCATGALRGGAGLVTIGAPADTIAALEGRVLEAMCAPFDYNLAREDALAALLRLVAGKRAIAWGPGMPTTPAAADLLRAAVRMIDLPLCLDADALNLLAPDPSVLTAARGPVVLTPHPGEAARLLHTTTDVVQADRVGAARRLAADTGAIVLLKGARTVVAASDGRAAINPTGNAGMATGGAGDVLTGLCGALLAQGLSAWDAARLAAYVHGRAGDLAASQHGQIGLTAGDIAAALGAAFVTLS